MSDAPEDSRQDSDPSTPTPPPPKGGDPMVNISGVNKHFGDLHVLKDINLTVGKGDVVVVLGPSGSGKSTLCRTINRLETFETGRSRSMDKPLPEEGKALADLRADVGMVFQSFNLFAHKTILAERHPGTDQGAQASRSRRPRSEPWSSSSASASSTRRTSTPRSSPAASSSGSPSLGLSR